MADITIERVYGGLRTAAWIISVGSVVVIGAAGLWAKSIDRTASANREEIRELSKQVVQNRTTNDERSERLKRIEAATQEVNAKLDRLIDRISFPNTHDR